MMVVQATPKQPRRPDESRPVAEPQLWRSRLQTQHLRPHSVEHEDDGLSRSPNQTSGGSGFTVGGCATTRALRSKLK